MWDLNVSTQVDIDFTKSEITEEIVDPDGIALRSEQSTLDLTTDLPAKGIPGLFPILHQQKLNRVAPRCWRLEAQPK